MLASEGYGRLAPAWVLSLLLFVAAGCAEDEITTYAAPPGSQPIGEPWNEGATYNDDDEREELPQWDVPSGWQRVEPQESARQATFTVELADDGKPLEVAVTRFPGEVGGMLANVNRWRAQVGLASLAEEELAEHVDLFDTPGFEVYAVRLDGEKQTIFAAGLFEPFANQTWFVRSHVDAAHADALAEDFFLFVRSFERPGDTRASSPDTGDAVLPGTHRANGDENSPAAPNEFDDDEDPTSPVPAYE